VFCSVEVFAFYLILTGFWVVGQVRKGARAADDGADPQRSL